MEKVKVGIVTLCDPKPNYGNRLQNYAVQEVLKKYGLKPTTYSVEGAEIKLKDWIHFILHKFTLYKFSKDKFFWAIGFRRRLVFRDFNRRYINMKWIYSINKSLSKQEDYFVLGSDQVWNCNWYHCNPLKKQMFLLSFAQPNQKICFSPSFGINELPAEWVGWFSDNITSIPYLSVREDTGASIIKELTDRECPVLIDPSMMLGADEWRLISNRPKRVDVSKPYLLTYFLGGRNGRIEEDINRFSKQYNLIVHNLLDYEESDLFVSGPSEFIYMIDNATLVLTDSFHACVFSFLFHKPFLVYERNGSGSNMMSRIETFLSKFHLERKYIDSNMENELLENIYDDGFSALSEEQEKVRVFLSEAFKLD